MTQSLNQFAQKVNLGQVDLGYGSNVIPGEIVSTETASLVTADWVKLSDVVGKVPAFAKCTADTDEAYGILTYNPKDINRKAGESIEVASGGTVVYLRATGAISRGVEVAIDTSETGGVTATTSAVKIIGHSLDKAAADGDLIRVHLTTPSFKVGS